jgi:hypothetical protein
MKTLLSLGLAIGLALQSHSAEVMVPVTSTNDNGTVVVVCVAIAVIGLGWAAIHACEPKPRCIGIVEDGQVVSNMCAIASARTCQINGWVRGATNYPNMTACHVVCTNRPRTGTWTNPPEKETLYAWHVEGSTNGATWRNVGMDVGAVSEWQVVDTNAPASHCIYRVRREDVLE